MVFALSALNRVNNFKRVCPGRVLDRVWLQDCRRVFGNPKSETLVCIYYSGRKAARVKFSVAFANSSSFFFFFCVTIGQEITHKTSYMTK